MVFSLRKRYRTCTLIDRASTLEQGRKKIGSKFTIKYVIFDRIATSFAWMAVKLVCQATRKGRRVYLYDRGTVYGGSWFGNNWYS